MKSLVESINLSLNEEKMFKVKNIYKDFDDSLEALKWLEEGGDGPNKRLVATITINGKVATLAFGKSTYNGKDDMMYMPETLFLFANKLNGHEEDLTNDYETMPSGEFADMVDRLITKYGD